MNDWGEVWPFTPLALSFAVLYADARTELFIDGRKLAPGTADHLGGDVKTLEPDAFGPALDRLGKDAKTVRVSADTAPLWVFDRLEKAGAVIDRGDDPCQLPKAIKTTVQIDGIRTAHRRDGASLTRFLAWLDGEAAKGSLMESACADKLESLRRGNDHFQGLSFPTISSAGANGAIVHYRVSEETDAPLRPKSLYLVDSGAQYLDGTTDVTRTIAIGEPTDEMRFDVIFCRNVVIYFDDPTQERIWSRFTPLMNPGATLYIGHSERVSGPASRQLQTAGLTTYRLGAA